MGNYFSVKGEGNYFSPSYKIARQRLRDAAEQRRMGDRCVDQAIFVHHLYPDLSIDAVLVGQKNPHRVVVTLSGVHGTEAAVGSACQLLWMQKSILNKDPGTAFYHVHAVNPWGAQNHRRVNENGVDLNRNGLASFNTLPQNPVYDELASLLVPEKWSDNWSKFFILAEYLKRILRGQKMETAAALTQGQYTDPYGIYYGGKERQWSLTVLEKALRHLAKSAPEASFVLLDIHSGLGEFGVGKILAHTIANESFAKALDGDTKKLSETALSQEKIPGDVLGLAEEALGKGLLFSGCLEFGTINPISIFLSLCKEASLTRQFGGEGQEVAEARIELENAFYPNGPRRAKFERKVMEDAERIMLNLLCNFRQAKS